MIKNVNLKLLLLLQGAVVIYSFADICAKLASRHDFLTPGSGNESVREKHIRFRYGSDDDSKHRCVCNRRP